MSNVADTYGDASSYFGRVFVAVGVALIAISCQPDALGAESTKLSISNGVRFLSPERAELRWESNLEGAASVAYGPTRKFGTVKQSSESGTSHRVLLDGLDPGQPIVYRIAVRHEGKRFFSPIFTIEAGTNYSVADVESPDAFRLDGLFDELSQLGGVAIVQEPLIDEWARTVAARSKFSVIAACNTKDRLQSVRQTWYADGVYGVRLTAQPTEEIPREIANLVVTTPDGINAAAQWISPSGALVCIADSRPPVEIAVEHQASDARGGKAMRILDWKSIDDGVWLGTQNVVNDLAEWGHQYGSASNASYVGESLSGADESDELRIRWLGRPGADFGIDRNPRMPAPLAVGGRLFHQGMNRMVALDAFNGVILWSIEMPDLRRVNIPRDSGNWCADENRVYAIARDSLWVIDAATGEMLYTLRHPPPHDEEHEWGYVAVTDDTIVGTTLSSGSAYEEFWDKAAWYDKINEAATAKICGNAIMAYDKAYGDLKWKRDVDAVVQSTITIQGDRMFFVEVEDESLKDQMSGKLADDQIWAKASVVCLDLATGKELWKQKTPPTEGLQVVAFGFADDSRFVLETSSGGKFHLTALDREDGAKQWSQSVDWPSDNHGAHMQHAVSMNGRLYLQPHILDASDGRVIQSGTLGKRRGCATPIGAGGSIIYRGGSGPVSLWSLENEAPTEFARLRPSCWLSTIPAQGMLFSPEAGGGCSCGGWMECSIGFAPMPDRVADKTSDKGGEE